MMSHLSAVGFNPRESEESCFPTSMPCRALPMFSSIQFSQYHLLKMLLSPAYRFGGGILVNIKPMTLHDLMLEF